LVCTTVAEAQTVRAVLVGVSDYLHLDVDLRGPANDIALMREALLARGVAPAAITLLGEGGAVPTRAAILGALDHLAADSAPGDTALFYFSGHGTQAPDRDGDEQGGMDEVFLPADARGWSASAGAVENGITDDELRARAVAILARGARLVSILDACHSGTGFRALGGQGVARAVLPDALGIPDQPGPEGVTPPPLTGDFAFLYAAQAEERAFEYPLGDAADPAGWHGAFTRALAQVLREAPDLTWDQAMQATRAGMGQGGTAQTPDAEGPMLAAAVFGTATPPPSRTGFDGDTLAAGLLHGIDNGAQLAIHADAASDVVLARAEVVDAGPRSARFRVIDGAAPGKGFAVVTAPGMPAEVRFSAPQPADGGDYGALLAAIQDTTGAIDGAVFGAMPFDIGLVLAGGGLALTGPDGVLDPTGPGSSPRVDPAEVMPALDRAVRVHRLRLALGKLRGSGAGSLMAAMSGLRVEVGYRPGQAGAPGCGDAGPETRPVRAGHRIAPCDQLWLHLKNPSATARDVTVLYVDAGNHVTALWPTGGLSNRLGFNEATSVGVQIVAGTAAQGREELIVIAVPAQAGAARADLTALADPAPSRAVAGAGAAGWLLAAADPAAAARGFDLIGPADPVEVTRIEFDYHSNPTEN
jgi:hypothetical protein